MKNYDEKDLLNNLESTVYDEATDKLDCIIKIDGKTIVLPIDHDETQLDETGQDYKDEYYLKSFAPFMDDLDSYTK